MLEEFWQEIIAEKDEIVWESTEPVDTVEEEGIEYVVRVRALPSEEGNIEGKWGVVVEICARNKGDAGIEEIVEMYPKEIHEKFVDVNQATVYIKEKILKFKPEVFYSLFG